MEANFQIKKIKETKDSGVFALEPLPQGYGHTLGNALRRVLLSSLSGAAINLVKITGARHRFSALEGMREDVLGLLLNLKKVRLAYQGEKSLKLKLEKPGPGPVKASDIQTPAGVTVVNPDLVLANLATRKNRLKMEMTLERGTGYIPAQEKDNGKIGEITVDALYSPVIRVNYRVEATRVGRRTDFDRLLIEIDTDATVKPQEALKQGSQILVEFFNQVVKPKKAPAVKEKSALITDEALRLTVEEIELPTRIANALRKAGYETVADLAAASVADLAKVKNLGSKSVKIVQAALAKKGLTLTEVKK